MRLFLLALRLGTCGPSPSDSPATCDSGGAPEPIASDTLRFDVESGGVDVEIVAVDDDATSPVRASFTVPAG